MENGTKSIEILYNPNYWNQTKKLKKLTNDLMYMDR